MDATPGSMPNDAFRLLIRGLGRGEDSTMLAKRVKQLTPQPPDVGEALEARLLRLNAEGKLSLREMAGELNCAYAFMLKLKQGLSERYDVKTDKGLATVYFRQLSNAQRHEWYLQERPVIMRGLCGLSATQTRLLEYLAQNPRHCDMSKEELAIALGRCTVTVTNAFRGIGMRMGVYADWRTRNVRIAMLAALHGAMDETGVLHRSWRNR